MNSKLHVCVFSVLGCIVSILFVPQPTFAQDPSGDDLRVLGRTAFYEGRYVDAERYFRQSVARVEGRSDGSPAVIAGARGDLAWILVVKGNYGEAERLLDSALRVLRSGSGEDCQQTAVILSHLGTVYQKTGRYARAEKFFKQTLTLSERCVQWYIQVALNNLGILYGETGRLKQAIPPLERSLALVEKQPKTGETPLLLAQTLTSLAAVHQARRNFPLTEQLLLRAIPVLEESLEGPYRGLAIGFLSLAVEQSAQVHYQQGKLDQSEQEFQRAKDLEIMRGIRGPRLSKLSFELAEVLTAKGNYDDAKIQYERALQEGEKDTAMTATIMERFSSLLRIMKADSQAAEIEFRAKKIRAALAYTTSVK
jgi:tetratricopeptide (TPR) repeat protein